MKPYGLGLYEKALPDALTWEQKLMETHICGFDWLEISIDAVSYTHLTLPTN